MFYDEKQFWEMVGKHPREALSHFTIVDPENWILSEPGKIPPALDSSNCRWKGPHVFSCQGRTYDVYVRASHAEMTRRLFLDDLGIRSVQRRWALPLGMVVVVVLVGVLVRFVLTNADLSRKNGKEGEVGVVSTKQLVPSGVPMDKPDIPEMAAKTPRLQGPAAAFSTNVSMSGATKRIDNSFGGQLSKSDLKMKTFRQAFDAYAKDRDWAATDSFVTLTAGENHCGNLGIGLVELKSGGNASSRKIARLRADAEARRALAQGLSPQTMTVSQSADGKTSSIQSGFNVTFSGVFHVLSSEWVAPDGRRFYVSVVAKLVDEQ